MTDTTYPYVLTCMLCGITPADVPGPRSDLVRLARTLPAPSRPVLDVEEEL